MSEVYKMWVAATCEAICPYNLCNVCDKTFGLDSADMDKICRMTSEKRNDIVAFISRVSEKLREIEKDRALTEDDVIWALMQEENPWENENE